MKQLIFIPLTLLIFQGCYNEQTQNAKIEETSYLDYSNRDDKLSGGVKMIPIQTSAGEFAAKDILIATDATTATQLLELGQVCRMQGCVTWYHATDQNPSGTGRLLIDGQKRGPVFNSLVISDISKAYAPNGMNLISSTTELGTTDSEVRRHLSTMWGVETRDWQLIAKYEIPSALPLHEIGKALTQPTKISDHLYVAGDHRTVPSQQGALFSGSLAAQLILN